MGRHHGPERWYTHPSKTLEVGETNATPNVALQFENLLEVTFEVIDMLMIKELGVGLEGFAERRFVEVDPPRGRTKLR